MQTLKQARKELITEYDFIVDTQDLSWQHKKSLLPGLRKAIELLNSMIVLEEKNMDILAQEYDQLSFL
jgi:hypothetical protein